MRRVESIDALAAGLEPEQRAIFHAARVLVRRLVPHAVERLRPGWGLVGYAAPRYFAFLYPSRGAVKLGFEWGVRLSNRAGLLEGEGTQVRFVSLQRAADLRRPALRALVMEAALLATEPPSRRRRSRTRRGG